MILTSLLSHVPTLLLSSQRDISASLHKRSSNCPSSYTTSNGLYFETLCSENIPLGDLYNNTQQADDMQSCMTMCSESTPDTCFGIVYNHYNHKCYLKNEDVYNTTSIVDGSAYSATANKSQLVPNSSETGCQYVNGTDQSTSNGMGFEIYCYTDMAENTYCPTTIGADTESCPTHTDSLQACMQICSEAHPLCYAAVYDASMSEGYPNCHLKSWNSANGYVVNETKATHMAVVTSKSVSGYTCKNGTTYTTDNGREYAIVDCAGNRASNDIQTYHTDNASACAEYCSSYSDITTGICVGAVFDPTILSGWENCFLKSALGGSDDGSALTVLALTSDLGAYSSNERKSSTSKAWIAGPVIGGLAGLALVAGSLLWRRRHMQKQLQSEKPAPPQAHNNITYMPVEGDYRALYEMPNPGKVPELGDTQATRELEGSSK